MLCLKTVKRVQVQAIHSALLLWGLYKDFRGFMEVQFTYHISMKVGKNLLNVLYIHQYCFYFISDQLVAYIHFVHVD